MNEKLLFFRKYEYRSILSRWLCVIIVEGNRIDTENNLHENKTDIANKPQNFLSIVLQIVLCHCWEALNKKTNHNGYQYYVRSDEK